jgi:hypothetical protein
MASYTVNQQAVARACQLIDARQYVLKSVWSDVQPGAADENAFLESHSWEEYAQWHLALTDGPATTPSPATPLSTATSAASTAWA